LRIGVSQLFTPLTLRGTTVKNRVWVSPMCQYSSDDGMPNDWHLVHLGARATGGWWQRITSFIHSQGAATGIQLAHAGRKASTRAPWLGRGPVDPQDGGWQTVAPSPLGYADWPTPKELSTQDIHSLVQAFAEAAARADRAGFDVLELHAAHGYLLHQFLSPLTNQRADGYGGDLAGRSRIVLEVVDAVRGVWPDRKPLFMRLSAADWAPGGWDVDETVRLARMLDGRSRPDHRAGTGRADSRGRFSGRRPAGPCAAARPVVAAAGRARAGCGRRLAAAVSARRLDLSPGYLALGPV
jgi:2,4-dienoyl-CoA reductase-like NADH-dependent reductase (Old Yellow Enzyme family)